MYKNIYSKYKKLKHENKSLKSKLADHAIDENQSNKNEATLAENNYLKFKNAKLVNKITMLELDVETLTEKLSNSMHEVEDLKYTLGRFMKRKNTLDSMLGIKTNFQREGLGYTPPEKSTPQKSKTIPQPPKFVKGTYVHVSQKITPSFLQEQLSLMLPRKFMKLKTTTIEA